MHLILFKDTLTCTEKFRNYLCLGIGLIGGIAATVMSIIDLVKAMK